MKVFGCFVLFFLVTCSSLSSICLALSDAEAAFITRRQLLTLPKDGKLPDNFDDEYGLKNKTFANERLKKAYVALQAFKKSIYSDPFNTTANWVDNTDVCSYNGVFCAPALDDPNITVVAGIDLNGNDIAGSFPAELGLLTDLALFHVNSNRFCGIIPDFSDWKLMFEFDVSNNRLVGSFPRVVLSWPSLKFLDLRYNNFEGELPCDLFDMKLDALFLNNNRFSYSIPEKLGRSTVSVVTFAHNNFNGCIPRSIGNMQNLNEIILSDNKLSGCFPSEIGSLKNLRVFDVSSNLFHGNVPQSFSSLESIQTLILSHNQLTGFVSEQICKLPSLSNFTFSYNYFQGLGNECIPGSKVNSAFDDASNCLAERPSQKWANTCEPVVSNPVDCSRDMCSAGGTPPSIPYTAPPKPTTIPPAPELKTPTPAPPTPREAKVLRPKGTTPPP
ncbi:hypothetical protein CISIN_1g035831mg, partial [Citrus sinensis]